MNFIYYSDLAQKTFNLLNGRINKINTNLILSISDDNEAYATIFRKSIVIININKIINDLRNEHDLIITNIIYNIAHELFHADQVVDDYNYLHNDSYKNKKEEEAIYRAITFILINKELIEEQLNIKINDEVLIYSRDQVDKRIGINQIADYERCNLEECIKTNLRILTKIEDLDLDDYDNVIFQIENGYMKDSIIIKSDGTYSLEAVNELQRMLRTYNNIDEVFYYIESNGIHSIYYLVATIKVSSGIIRDIE